jgi:hypothetical protein
MADKKARMTDTKQKENKQVRRKNKMQKMENEGR